MTHENVITATELERLIANICTMINSVDQLSTAISNFQTMCSLVENQDPILNEFPIPWIDMLKKREMFMRLQNCGSLGLQYYEEKFKLMLLIFKYGFLKSYNVAFGEGRLSNLVKLLSPERSRSTLVDYSPSTKKDFQEDYVGRELDVELYNDCEDFGITAFPIDNFFRFKAARSVDPESETKFLMTGSQWKAIAHVFRMRYIDLIDPIPEDDDEMKYPGTNLINIGRAIPNVKRRQMLSAKKKRHTVRLVYAKDPEHLICLRHSQEEMASIREKVKSCELTELEGLPTVGEVVCFDPDKSNVTLRQRAMVLHRFDSKNILHLLLLDTGELLQSIKSNEKVMRKLPLEVEQLPSNAVLCVQCGISPGYKSEKLANTLWRIVIYLLENSASDIDCLAYTDALEEISSLLEHEIDLKYKIYALVYFNRLILTNKLPYVYIMNSKFLRNLFDSMQSVLEFGSILASKNSQKFLKCCLVIVADLLVYDDSLRSWIIKSHGERLVPLSLAAASLSGSVLAFDHLMANFMGGNDIPSHMREWLVHRPNDKTDLDSMEMRKRLTDMDIRHLEKQRRSMKELVVERSEPVHQVFNDRKLIEEKIDIPLDVVDELQHHQKVEKALDQALPRWPALSATRLSGLLRGAVFPYSNCQEYGLVLSCNDNNDGAKVDIQFRDLIPTMVGMLNSGFGGSIYLGVDPQTRFIHGVQVGGEDEDKFRIGFDQMTDIIQPRPLPTLFNVQFVKLAQPLSEPKHRAMTVKMPKSASAGSLRQDVEGHFIIEVSIQAQKSLVYSYESMSCCVRKGGVNVPLTPNEAQQLVAVMVAGESIYANECVFYQNEVWKLENEVKRLENLLPV